MEYVIEDGSAPVTDVATLYAGTVNAAAGRVENLSAHALLYISDGKLHRIPLAANGASPASQLRSDTLVGACKVSIDPSAIDYAAPDATPFVVTTKGPDGLCGTADDAVNSRRYDSATGAFVSSSTASLGMIRDPATLAPAYSLDKYGVSGGGHYLPLSGHAIGAPTPEVRHMLATAPGLGLLDIASSDADSELHVVDVVGVSHQALGQSLTGGGNWQLLGHDATAFYVYRNSGTTTLSTWSVVKITKRQPVATRLASGTGLIANAAMGQGLLYLTVQQASANKLYAMSKSAAGVPVEMESTPVTSVTTVLTSGSGVHQFLRASGLGGTPSYRVDMVDESGTVRATAANALPLALMDPAAIDLTRSESRTRFIYAAGIGSQGYADADLIGFDAASANPAPVAIGKLPGASSFAGNAAYANAAMAMNNFVAGQVIASSNGSFLSGGAKVFSFKADTANSLAFTTVKR
ncbi:MAG: hypothetical protein HY020_17900 [Burkholderiales bacterium]|nr:hypothetical protein [Burkholderiales bacterium]